jgi:hypothetical protein
MYIKKEKNLTKKTTLKGIKCKLPLSDWMGKQARARLNFKYRVDKEIPQDVGHTLGYI